MITFLSIHEIYEAWLSPPHNLYGLYCMINMRVTVKKQVNKRDGKEMELKWIFDCKAKPHFVFYTFIISIVGGLIIGYNIPTKWSNNILNTVLSTDCPEDDTSALVFPNSFKFKGKIKSVKKLRRISGEVLIAVSLQQNYASGIGEIEASANTWGKNCQNRSREYGAQCLYYVAQDWMPSEKWVLSGRESKNDKNMRQQVVRLEDVETEDGNGLKKYFVIMYHMYKQFSTSFEWFLLIPEKNYVQIEKLMTVLRKYDSNELMYIGNPDPNIGETHCEIQSGIALSRELLQKLGPILNYCVKRLNSLNFEKELSICISNIAPLPCMKPDNINFGYPETGAGVSGRKKKQEFPNPTSRDNAILGQSVTIKLPSVSNQYYYNLHKFIKFTESNQLRLDTLAIRKDMMVTENTALGATAETTQIEERDNELFPKQEINNDEIWLNGSASGNWLRNGSIEWIKMETFGKTHMYRLITLDSKPHRTIHGSWDETLLESLELIVKNEVDVHDKSIVNMKTVYAGVDVTSGAKYRYRVEKMRFNTKYFMGLQHFLPLEIKEDVNLNKIKLALPIDSLNNDHISSEVYVSETQMEKQIKFLITLSGRPDNLKRFLTEFNKAFLNQGHNVMLHLVLFRDVDGNLPTDDEQIKNMISEIRAEFGSDRVKSKLLDGSFSRGLGLQEGMKDMGEDDLVFFCDIDLVMTYEILDRIRRNTIKGKQVYFPVFLSQYDPDRSLIYVKPPTTYFDVERERGYWRYYSYGMVSLYAADFFQTKGFKLDIGGWGLEDLEFAEEVISSNIAIHRCADPGLIHIYHDKYCSPDLPETQLDMCVATKVTHYADTSVLYKMWRDNKKPMKSNEKNIETEKKITAKPTRLNNHHKNVDIIQETEAYQKTQFVKKEHLDNEKVKLPENKVKTHMTNADVKVTEEDKKASEVKTSPKLTKVKNNQVEAVQTAKLSDAKKQSGGNI